MNREFHFIGKNLPVNNAEAKASGSLRYAGDIQLPHMLHMKVLTSPIAHGIVRSVDAREALAMEGVHAFLFYGNTPGIFYDQGRVRANEGATDQQSLFTDHVRFVGDAIGAVVAENPRIAARALEVIKVEIDPLPAYITVEQALYAEGNRGLHEENECIEAHWGYDKSEKADSQFHDCEIPDGKSAGREELFTTSSQRVTHLAMETHAAVADYDPGTDSITVWSPCQSVFGARSLIHTLFGIPMSRIRAIKTPMGGSFGGKQEMIMEPLAAAGSIATGHPVKIVLTREEEMTQAVLRHPIQSTMKIRFDEEKKLQEVDLDCILDAGGYQTVSPDYAAAIYAKLSWTYDIPRVTFHSRSVCTNTPISGGYRAWGGPEEAFIMEEALNEAAARFGMDPIELRLRNLLPEKAASVIGSFALGSCKRRECLLMGRRHFRWDERRKEAEKTRGGRYVRGVGMALSVHTSGQYPRKNDWSTVGIKLEEDGSVTVNCNAHDHGCGAVTAFRKIAAETLGVPYEWVNIPQADSMYNWIDNGCYSSRSIYVTGRSIQEASEELLEKIRQQGALLADCPYEELIPAEKPEAVLVRVGTGETYTYSQIAYYAADRGCGDISVHHTYKPKTNPGPAVADFAEVEIDTETGKCRVLDFLAVHDIGKVINPISCRSQVGSAIQQSIGLVFSEKVEIDPETGVVQNATLKKYHPARAVDMPHTEVLFIEEPDDMGPFGAKSIGEAALVPVVPAILAAVNHALESELHDLPLRPETILKARQEQQNRSENR